MMLSPAHSTSLPFEMDATTVVGARLRGSAREGVDGWLETEGANLVGQETVTLSTTPAFENGRLVPRPMSLRVFLARTAQGGWQAMHGGFARIGRSKDATAIAMQRGGSVADVWVISDGPVDHTSLLPGDFDPLRAEQARGAAEPGRRQPLLARALCRAGRGDHAARAGLSRAACGDRRPGAPTRRLFAQLLPRSRHRGRPRRSRCALQRARRGPAQRRPCPGPLLRRWLDRAERSRPDHAQPSGHAGAGG